ncbi:MAG TPA: hypothetical protein VF642_01110 [Propionibacteriaceae bacterium]
MSEPSDDRDIEDRLTGLLTAEADRVTPSPDALSTIRARLTVRPERAGRRSTRVPLAPRRRWSLVGAGMVGVGVAAAVLVFAVTSGIHTDQTPAPAQSPGLPSAPFTAVPQTAAPTVLAVYRLGAGDRTLYREWTPVTQPFSRAQALQALLGTPPADDSLSSAPTGSGFRVGSVTENAATIVVDLTANDTSVRPPGGSASVADQWVQSWVYTVQDAYGTTLPVTITLNGRPTTLYGAVDTTEPISRDTGLRVRNSYGIFSPRPGSTVTSPVQLSALAPVGEAAWTVVDTSTRRVVFQAGESRLNSAEGPGTLGAELPPGAYQGTYELKNGSGAGFRRTVDFTVSGPAATTSATPVTNPRTAALPVVGVYRVDERNQQLVPRWVPRPADAVALVQGLLAPRVGTTEARDRLAPSAEVTAVTERGDRIEVQLATLNPGLQSPPAIARLRAQALVWTLTGYVGASKPVDVTVKGRPVDLFGTGTTAGITRTTVPVADGVNIASPSPMSVVAPAVQVVAGVPSGTRTVNWFVFSADTEQVLFQGSVTGLTDASPGFGFILDLPGGSYRLEVGTTGNAGGDEVDQTEFSVR